MTRAGTLADCQNYEVASRAGLTRIDGFERFDGRPGVAEHRVLRLTVSSISGNFAVGDRVQFDDTGGGPLPHEEIDGYVVSSTNLTAGSAELCVVFAGGMGDPTLPDTLLNMTNASTGQADTYASLSVADGEQQDFDNALFELAAARRAQVTIVPGRAGTDVIGGFLFKNKNYAIRDLPRIYFEDGYYTDADEGKKIVLDGTNYLILDVRVIGDESGFIAYDPVPSPGGVVATGFGSPTLTTLPVSGSLDGGLTTIPYSDGLVPSGGLPPYAWSLAEGLSAAAAPQEPGDLSEVTLLSEVTPAALWRSSPTGWQRVDLGREIAFRAGTPELTSTPRALNLDPGDIQSTGFIFPGLSEINGVSAPNLNADDGVTASLSGVDGQTIWCRDFDFSGVPAGAQIVGVEVRVERQANVGGGVAENTVILTSPFGGTENKAGLDWPSAMTVDTIGSASDLWGSENITHDVLQDPNFGVLLFVVRANPANPIVATMDHVAMNVHYVPRGGRVVYSHNGVSDVPLTLMNVQILSGDSDASTAAGYLTVNAAVNASKSRLIAEGETIYTQEGGGGDALCVVASRDRPIFLPGQLEVDNNRSQYQWDKFNFFGQDRYAAMYGVSGAGPAMAFDGTNLIKIRTPLSPGEDIPRHSTKHGNSLLLGYFSGAVAISAVGEPYEMRAVMGASAIETGDRLTALAPGGGDAVIIVCESSTFVLRGLSLETYSQQTVSAQRGAIEYTLADPGRAIISDSFGLFAADTPESFAAASRNYLSSPVEPWLRERLQATLSNEQRYLRPVCAHAIRSKSQYRMFFRDGAVLTMTAIGEGVEITRQRLYTPGTPDLPLTARRVWGGLDAAGRERLFITFNLAKEGLVFELDVGRSFDGEEIPAFFVLNPYSAGSTSQLKRFDRYFFAGAGGHAVLQWSCGINGQYPEGRVVEGELGRADQPTTAQNGSRRSMKTGELDLPAEAYDVLLRVDSLTNREAPHTLQYIEPFVDVRGDSRGHQGD